MRLVKPALKISLFGLGSMNAEEQEPAADMGESTMTKAAVKEAWVLARLASKS